MSRWHIDVFYVFISIEVLSVGTNDTYAMCWFLLCYPRSIYMRHPHYLQLRSHSQNTWAVILLLVISCRLELLFIMCWSRLFQWHAVFKWCSHSCLWHCKQPFLLCHYCSCGYSNCWLSKYWICYVTTIPGLSLIYVNHHINGDLLIHAETLMAKSEPAL